MDSKYPNNIDETDDLLNYFQRQKTPHNENYLGENLKHDTLIVVDNVSGLADKSETFANFLTVLRKFGLACVLFFIRYTQLDKTGK